MLFWANIAADIRSAALAELYSVPIRPAGETNNQALALLRLVHAAAESYERKIQVVQTQVNRSRGGSRGTTNNQAFLTVPEGVDPEDWVNVEQTQAHDQPDSSSSTSSRVFNPASESPDAIYARAEDTMA
eukprot:scaffold14491_cov25-Attheya_sp.AAC.1